MKPVLIIENSNNALKLNENSENKKDYTLNGVFTEFDITNRNERIYTADEYVPHVHKMMEKKEWGVIYGEYDHPDVFDVSMKCVSHTVENAVFNKEKNRIDGEIRLLNTHYGKDAKSLVDDGLPLFVSSRAAGITEANGKVKLKSLFTYDIVADPGFSSARMQVKNLNESLNLKSSNCLILESSKHQLAQIAKSHEEASRLNIIDFSDEIKTNEFFNMNKNDLVTKKQMTDWTNYLVTQIKENQSNITKMITNKKSELDVKKVEELLTYKEELDNQLFKMKGYMDYLSEKLQYSFDTIEVLEKKSDKMIKYTDYLSETLDKTIGYSKYLAEEINSNIGYSNYLAEGLEKNIGFSNYLAENVEKAIDYSEYLSENLTSSIKFVEYIAENVEKTINYTEYIAENLDVNVAYTSYIAENVDVNVGYTQYLCEQLESTINYTDYISECVDKSVDYSNQIAESINKNGSNNLSEKIKTADEYLIKTLIKENKTTVAPVTESVEIKTVKTVGDFKKKLNSTKGNTTNLINTNESKSVKETAVETPMNEDVKTFKSFINSDTDKISLNSKIEKLIEEASKREASKDNKPHFYEFLLSDDLKAFESLSNEDQECIKVAIKESTGYYSRKDVLSLINQVLEKKKPSEEDFLVECMPSDIKPLWEQLDVKMKKTFLSQATLYDIKNNKTIAEHFWSTRNFDFLKSKNRVLLESNNPLDRYSKLQDDDIEMFTKKFKNL